MNEHHHHQIQKLHLDTHTEPNHEPYVPHHRHDRDVHSPLAVIIVILLILAFFVFFPDANSWPTKDRDSMPVKEEGGLRD